MIKKLDWDSAFFDLKVGEINFETPFNKNEVVDFDLIYALSENDFSLGLENFSNSFSEVKVFFLKDLVANNSVNQPIFKYSEIDVETEQLYQLAYESGKSSRFLLDTRFNSIHFKNLYKAWIDNSINRKFADDILVYFEDNIIKGFVSYKINDHAASVGLIAVSSANQGKGIGAKLLNYLEFLLHSAGVSQLSIPTQLSNIQACSFYTKQGYSIRNKIYIKHFWNNDTIQ